MQSGDVVSSNAAASHLDPAGPASGLTATVAGSGPTVVMVHGMLGDYRQWTTIGDRLRGAHTAIAISRRYHWPNPLPAADARYTYEAQRDDLVNYLRGRGEAVHLVGHSYGAGVSLLAALQAPHLVRTLTLIEPAFNSLLPDTSPGLAEETAGRLVMVTQVKSLTAAGEHDDAARALIDWTQGGAGGFSRLSGDAQAALLDNAASLGPTVAHPAPHVSPADVRTLGIPALVVTGARTRLYYRLIAGTVAVSLPDARAAQVADAGHMSIVEQPARVADLILAFVGEKQLQPRKDDTKNRT